MPNAYLFGAKKTRILKMLKHSLLRLCILGLGLQLSASPRPTNLSLFARNYNLKLSVASDHVKLSGQGHTFVFIENTKEGYFDGTKIFLTYPFKKETIVIRHPRLFKKRNTWDASKKEVCYLDRVDVDKIVKPLFYPKTVTRKPGKIIVIDPGHGGKADGAINKTLSLKEKSLTLRTANKLAKVLRAAGYKVYLTRSKDIDISLDERARFANDKKASIFISIHYNAAASTNASGIEIFTYPFTYHPSTNRDKPIASDRLKAPINAYDSANTCLAWSIQNSLRKYSGLPDRGIRRGRMGVLSPLNCPGVLIECGFLSNNMEAKKINTEAYQDQLTQSILMGVKAFL